MRASVSHSASSHHGRNPTPLRGFDMLAHWIFIRLRPLVCKHVAEVPRICGLVLLLKDSLAE